MYVHIGGDYTISDSYIVGIFDIDQTTGGESDTVRYLNEAERSGRIEIVSPELPRSFVVTLDRVYISPLSVATIKKRLVNGAQGNI
jgi:hypothetical protein